MPYGLGRRGRGPMMRPAWYVLQSLLGGGWMDGRSREGTGGGLVGIVRISQSCRPVVGVEDGATALPDRRHRPTDTSVSRVKTIKQKEKEKDGGQTGEIKPQQKKKGCVSKRWTTTTRPCRAHHLGWPSSLLGPGPGPLCVFPLRGQRHLPPAAKTAYHLLQCVIPYHTTQIFHHFLPSSACKRRQQTRTGNDFWWLSK